MRTKRPTSAYSWAALSMADESRPGLRRRLVSLLDAEVPRYASPSAFAAGMVAASAIITALSLVRADRRPAVVEQPLTVLAELPRDRALTKHAALDAALDAAAQLQQAQIDLDRAKVALKAARRNSATASEIASLTAEYRRRFDVYGQSLDRLRIREAEALRAAER